MSTLLVRLLALCLLLSAAAAPAREGGYLPPDVARVLAQRKLPETSVSIYVREVGRAEPLLALNADVPRNPASTMKVLTTWAALELLGPAHTWRTRAYAHGPVRDGVLEGNLVLVGGGDPFMTAERWWGFVAGVRQAGVERVTGDVVIDNGYFAPQGEDRGAFDNRPQRTYNVLPDALLVNFQTVQLSLVPDAASGRVVASAWPWPRNLVLENAVSLESGRCRRGTGGVAVTMPDGPTAAKLRLAGSYAAACGPASFSRAVMRAPEFAYGTFKTFFEQAGGRLEGGMRMGALPPDARQLHSHDSVSLAEVIRLVNKFSSNVMARHLLLTIGAEKGAVPGTAAGGRQAVMALLAERGIALPGLVLENGSGLSRSERISARGLTDVLAAAHASQFMPEFAASLPLSATDGTLRRRFRSPDMEGRLRMKTGSLDDVSALAGFVNAASGRTYLATIIVNHPGAENGSGEALQAAVVQWVFGQ
jgi:D-alanyl-D-alanine carboxypeptidase/D-alanyl-D-alanine-endopeptidase (penicillin-binding protein 4)